tara:strand:- start:4192 stop:5013 length:822 start_codon:yes stop_codon:yes gene_type:complete
MKNSYQFIHLETYSDVPKKNSKRPSAEAVARECQRKDESYPHIASANEPDLLYGIQPLEALSNARKLIKQCKDPLGRKIRKDAPIISFGVASIKVESTPENWQSDEVQKWIEDTIEFLKQRFGDSFVSLCSHSDERLCHLHFGIVPKLNKNGSIDLGSFHPGLAAQRAVKINKKSAKDHAYKSAMVEFQDQYYAGVGIINGQLRYGPRRRRLTRKEWHSQRQYGALISKLFNDQASNISLLTKKLNKAKEMLKSLFTSRIVNDKTNSFQEKGV